MRNACLLPECKQQKVLSAQKSDFEKNYSEQGKNFLGTSSFLFFSSAIAFFLNHLVSIIYHLSRTL